MQVTAVLTPASEGGFVALNPETGTTTQGESIDEALTALREAVELHVEEFPLGTVGAPLVTTLTVAEHAYLAGRIRCWPGPCSLTAWLRRPDSHIVMRRGGLRYVVPLHNGTLAGIVRQVGLSPDEVITLL